MSDKKGTVIKWVGDVTVCDVCGKEFGLHFYDARTVRGSWGLLCSYCHLIHGVGLGVGKGQMYRADTKVKVGG